MPDPFKWRNGENPAELQNEGLVDPSYVLSQEDYQCSEISNDVILNDEISEEEMSDELSCRQFQIKFCESIDQNEAQGTILFATIARRLKNYNLAEFYSVEDVVHEVYERGVKANRKERIRNVPAWINRVSQYVISEWSRRDRRTTSADEILENYPAPRAPLPDDELSAKLRLVRLAAQNLKPRSQRILQLKVIESLSWRDIQLILHKEGYGDYTESALRQQKVRALAKLRRLFHELEGPPEN